MRQHRGSMRVSSRRGLTEVTSAVQKHVADSGIAEGLCTVFIRHTSASLVIQENADPSVRRDLEAFMSRWAPDGDPLFTHVMEGPDDMPAHMKAAVLPVSLSVPVSNGRLDLGTWQGIYLWEHRAGAGRREVVVHVVGE